MAETPNVQPGQVWADNDKRSAGREVTVLLVSEVTDPFSHRKIRKALVQDNRGRQSQIRVDRFRPNSNGYRLIREAGES